MPPDLKNNMVITLKEKNKRVINPRDVFNILTEVLTAEDEIDQAKEHFWVLHLDTRNSLKLLELVALGTINASLVHPREVFTRAVANRSVHIIITHNHPSGESDPSEDDITITKRLVEAGKILDIKVIDHVIIGKGNFTSFKEKKLL